MDADLKQELEWMNANLNSVVTNQAILYCVLKKIEEEVEQKAEKQ